MRLPHDDPHAQGGCGSDVLPDAGAAVRDC